MENGNHNMLKMALQVIRASKTQLDEVSKPAEPQKANSEEDDE